MRSHETQSERIKAQDSPRFCHRCQTWGDHHTDRCPCKCWYEVPGRGRLVVEACAIHGEAARS